MKASTKSFVTTIPLRVTPAQAHILDKRFRLSKMVYNSCLGRALDIADAMLQSKAWQAARAMPKGEKGSKAAKARADAFKAIKKEFGFNEFTLLYYKGRFSQTYLSEHIDSKVSAGLARRAYTAVNSYLLGIRGRPTFVREINSVEGESNESPLRWCETYLRWGAGPKGLTLAAEIDYNRPNIVHGLSCRVKYARLYRETIRGKVRYFAQLINEGVPYCGVQVGQGVIGLDIGPQTVAIVAPEKSNFVWLCQELKDQTLQVKALQRQIDRMRRLLNEKNYEPDFTDKRGRRKKGKIKKGRLTWVKSNRMKTLELRLRELKRKQAEHRFNLHGRLVNEIIGMGDTINLEDLSYRAFQKMFGKSVGMRAPGAFVAKLREKHAAGVLTVTEFSTQTTKLSQVDHKTGEYQKKGLGVRVHRFEDGEIVQRDLYSAFLAACVEDGQLNFALANERWAHVKPLLDAAWADIHPNAPTSMGKMNLKK